MTFSGDFVVAVVVIVDGVVVDDVVVVYCKLLTKSWERLHGDKAS